MQATFDNRALTRMVGASPLSLLALQILRDASDPDASLRKVSDIVQADPAFALRVVSTVNSSVFALRAPVGDVRTACNMIGLRGLRNIALLTAFTDIAPPRRESEVFIANSLRRAVAALLLAERLEERNVDDYFTMGLFLEIGLLILARSNLELAVELARCPAQLRVERELEQLPMAHDNAGADLAELLRLPAPFVLAIREHHTSQAPSSRSSRIVWAAERIAAIWEGGELAENYARASEALASLGLDEAELDTLLETLPQALARVAEALNRRVRSQMELKMIISAEIRELAREPGLTLDRLLRLEPLTRGDDFLTRQFTRARAILAARSENDWDPSVRLPAPPKLPSLPAVAWPQPATAEEHEISQLPAA